MKIHEYQAKEILKKFGVPIPQGEPAFTPEQAQEIAERLGGDRFVVKAQIHAGGRGKGGGIRLAKTPEEVKSIAREMLAMRLITHQTGAEGKVVRRLLVEQGIEIAQEFYAGIVFDRENVLDLFMVSTEGGVEIEKVASETPEKIVKVPIHPLLGIKPYQLRTLAYGLHLSGRVFSQAIKLFQGLYQAYRAYDASLVEINPLVLTSTEELIALDTKMNFDDNALSRHPDVMEMRDLDEEDPAEVQASHYNLNYIKLNGNVGCMVNGAGLAMATMDIIKLAGGEPANFLDVGGSASAETVKAGFGIIMNDPNVRTVLINIFGGIVRCDRVAQGIIDALSDLQINIPVVVRLEGTNADMAARMLEESPLKFTIAKDLKEAAHMAVTLANDTVSPN